VGHADREGTGRPTEPEENTEEVNGRTEMESIKRYLVVDFDKLEDTAEHLSKEDGWCIVMLTR